MNEYCTTNKEMSVVYSISTFFTFSVAMTDTTKPSKTYEFGLDSFGDVATDESGKLMSYAASIRQVVKEAVLADSLGVSAIGLGEHHRFEFAISSPEMVLASIASVTKQIKLASAVTVLSSDDPVRVFERFSTLDALSNGRAQVILGRGSFTESFPLFGYDLRDYEALFEEKIALFAELLKEKPVTWSGSMRPSLDKADVFPKTESGRLSTFVGVGGSPDSVIRTARYGFGLMFAIIGGSPSRFVPYVDLYKKACEKFGTPVLDIGVHSPGFVGDTDQEAIDRAWPTYKIHHDRIGKTRGWPPISKEQYEHEIMHGSLYIGSPETVAKKIANTLTVLGAKRFDMVYGFGPVSANDREKTVTLYGKKVIPQVLELLHDK